MIEFEILRELVVIFLAAVLITLLFKKLQLPNLVGFLLTGILIGPYGLAFVRQAEHIQTIAQIGVVLLLFIIGLEFSIKRLMSIRRVVFLGGGLQVLLTVAVVAGVVWLGGMSAPESVFWGFLIAVSSTAIIMKILAERAETDAPQGKIALGISLFQDLCVVPMMLLTPVLGGVVAASLEVISLRLAFSLATVFGVWVVARYAMPKILEQLVRLRSREIFLLGVIVICIGTAWVTSLVGLSLALGAFIAGLVLSESEYSHEMVAVMAPFRDVFSSLFFISIGMLLKLDFVVQSPLLIGAVSTGIIIVKLLVVVAIVHFLGYPLRTAFLAAIMIAQIGEFSFILAPFGLENVLLTQEGYQVFLASSVVTMTISPLFVYFAPNIAERLQKLLPQLQSSAEETDAAVARKLQNHVIIVGYGLNGRNLATVLKETGILYAILELNPESVQEGRARGEPIFFGDATYPEVLNRLHIESARVVVIAIYDPDSSRRILRIARHINPHLHIIVRTRHVSEIEELYNLGADQVIPEEFETSVEIFTRVLREYHIPRNVIAAQVDLIRREGYGMLRGLKLPEATMSQLEQILAAGTTDTFLVLKESPACGNTLAELNIRKSSGALVIAVVRGDKPITNPPADFRVQPGDVLVMIGTHAEIETAFEMLSPPRKED